MSSKHDILKAFNNMDMFLQLLEKEALSKDEIKAFVADIKKDIEKAKREIDEVLS